MRAPDQEQVTAQSLIEENEHLRQQLRHSQALIQELEAEAELQLVHQKKHQQHKGQESQYQGVIEELKEELWTIYDRNQ